jgi:WD40 repeat protein
VKIVKKAWKNHQHSDEILKIKHLSEITAKNKENMSTKSRSTEECPRSAYLARNPTPIHCQSRFYRQFRFLQGFKNLSQLQSMELSEAIKLLSDYQIYLEADFQPITSVAITNDNNYIVSGSRDAIVRLWNLKEKRQVLSKAILAI